MIERDLSGLLASYTYVLRLLAGLLLSVLIGWLAYQRKSLSLSGVVGAIITGTLVFGFGGWVWGLTLIAFFIYESGLSHFRERQKQTIAAEKFDKSSQRDLGQALANAGLASILAVLFFLNSSQLWLFAAFVGAMSTMNADTWATEIGVLSRRPPRSIISGRIVPGGTSGGITVLGTLASAGGGLVMGLTVWLLLAGRGLFTSQASLTAYWWVLPAGLLAGLLGSLVDSLLGATVQAMYSQAGSGQETERKLTQEGVKNTFRRGWPLMDNDAVNFISSLAGTVVAAATYTLLVN